MKLAQKEKMAEDLDELWILFDDIRISDSETSSHGCSFDKDWLSYFWKILKELSVSQKVFQ